MSLLRLCAFTKCVNTSRMLLEKCAVRTSPVSCCPLCFSTRNSASRRTGGHLTLQTRNVSFFIPKTDDNKKRLLEQSLVDVLEARIKQLQSDIVDVQHAKVQIVSAPSSGTTSKSSDQRHRNPPLEKANLPKSSNLKSSKSNRSRCLQKLSQEKEDLLKNEQLLQQKIHTKFKECLDSRMADDIVSDNNVKKKRIELSEIICAAVSPASAKSAATQKNEKCVRSPNAKENAQTKTILDAEAQVFTAFKKLEKRLIQQQRQGLCSHPVTEEVQDNETLAANALLSVNSFLEACVFAGDIDRAYNFLLNQHRLPSKKLNTDSYNIMMRFWAKQGLFNKIGIIFTLLEAAGLNPNLESYRAALECMGRMKDCSHTIIVRCLCRMVEEGHTLDDLFTQCKFREDEWAMVLKAIHVARPNYQPALPTSEAQQYSSLVENFYTQRTEHRYPKLHFTKQELLEGFNQQLKMEEDCFVTIDSVEASKPITEKTKAMRELLSQIRAEWHETLLKVFKENKKITSRGNPQKNYIYPYLCLLKDSEYVDIMVKSVPYVMPNGDSLQILARDLGTRVYTKFLVKQKQQNQVVQKLSSIYSSYTDVLAKDTAPARVLPRERWCDAEAEHMAGPSLNGAEYHWPHTVTFDLGLYLLEMMLKNLKINSNVLNPGHSCKPVPILYHMYTFRKVKQVGFIKPHPVLTQILKDARETTLTFESYVIPTLCPPIPWTSTKLGAYLLIPSKLMRTQDGATQHETLLEKQNLQPIFDSLNQLGNCAWKVNKPILDIIISIFNDKGNNKLDIPPPVSEGPKIPQYDYKGTSYTTDEKMEMKTEVFLAKKKCAEMHSLRMDALYKLSIANYMRDKVFWFPHNMDFRGRTYPIPPHFNHLGSDVTRAILLFAEGKPLGPKGLDWLKIHLVNLTGLEKKSSLQGRLNYANSIMTDILDAADNPLKGKKWWMEADEPWQALACCMEIANAVRSPDPEQFISHFPIHQDGSCNGLQHYAALGRDVIGATSVNLMPCELPQDVYIGVAQQVEELRKQDAKKGLEIAEALEGFIGRKVVKQTVMTVVYGVTRFGGRLQIEKRLNEIDEFPKECVFDASNYLVQLVFSALKEMFTGTREIQDWLTNSARLIAKIGHAVDWVTPLGLPVIQPYHRKRTQVVKGSLQQINLQMNANFKERPDTIKQKNAFPPNFIHSLDSTHMMLTSLHCHGAGLTFVSVHDCFWTHADTVDTMNKICREQFVALHSQPILQDLSVYLLQKYYAAFLSERNGKKFHEYWRLMLLLDKVPKTGDFDLEQVKKSTYFFS